MKRIEIQQGNVVQQGQLDQLSPGISREQVRYLLGTPLVTDQFDPDNWYYYLYTRDNSDKHRSFRATVHFVGDSYASYKLDGEYFDLEE